MKLRRSPACRLLQAQLTRPSCCVGRTIWQLVKTQWSVLADSSLSRIRVDCQAAAPEMAAGRGCCSEAAQISDTQASDAAAGMLSCASAPASCMAAIWLCCESTCCLWQHAKPPHELPAAQWRQRQSGLLLTTCLHASRKLGWSAGASPRSWLAASGQAPSHTG